MSLNKEFYLTDYRLHQFGVYFVTFLWALIMPDILNYFGMQVGTVAIDYYAEIHQSPINIYIHTIMLPISIGGYCLGVPALFCLPPYWATLWRTSMYLMYFIHYFTINQCVAYVFLLIYGGSLYFAEKYYKNDWKTAVKGLAIAWGGVFYMEFIGHSLFETAQSRPEGVLNAILYSPYFTSQEIVTMGKLMLAPTSV